MSRLAQTFFASALWLSFQDAHLALASNGTMYLYSGGNCQDPNPIMVPGLKDGICTQITNSFWSFKLGELDQGCTSTVYSRDNQYCGNSIKTGLYEVFLNECIGNDTSINQFSVDCPSVVVNPSPSEPASGSSRSLRLGLGIGVPLGSLSILTIAGIAWWCIKRKKRGLQPGDNTSPPAYAINHEKEDTQLTEADGQGVFRDTTYEIGHDKRQSRICELDGRWEGSEMEASSNTPTASRERDTEDAPSSLRLNREDIV